MGHGHFGEGTGFTVWAMDILQWDKVYSVGHGYFGVGTGFIVWAMDILQLDQGLQCGDMGILVSEQGLQGGPWTFWIQNKVYSVGHGYFLVGTRFTVWAIGIL